jgi:hypothetical protein
VEPFDHDTLALPSKPLLSRSSVPTQIVVDDPPDDLLSKVFLVRGIENNRITVIPVNVGNILQKESVSHF